MTATDRSASQTTLINVLAYPNDGADSRACADGRDVPPASR